MTAAVQAEAARLLGTEAVAVVRGRAGFGGARDVDALATGAVGAFADAVAALVGSGAAEVDAAQVPAWFRQAVAPAGWTLPSPWDAVAGDYRAADGWIRLHTNAPRHRAAALRVLGAEPDRDAVAARVSTWAAEDLERAVVDVGGAAAVLHGSGEWAASAPGAAVLREPLIDRLHTVPAASGWRPEPARPLRGVRVLDLTRVIAGPVATRALAGLGATVLRIDPPDWDEPALVPDMTLGKRATRLDARTPEGRDRLQHLLTQADVLVHGYRRGALEPIGLGDGERQRLRPGLVEVALTAYGWTGPWTGRRGFDSLVQMSTGIAAVGPSGRPEPLPVQALDHATGWLMAAAAVAGLRDRLRGGSGSRARLSLARTAAELLPQPPREPVEPTARTRPIATPWGPATLADPPFTIDDVTWGFDEGPAPLGSAAPVWP